MESRRYSGILAIIALVAVGIYSLSCKPAWGPDSGTVAYIAVSKIGEGVNPIEALVEMTKGTSGDKGSDNGEGEDGPRYSVAVYDLKTRECESVFGETRDEDGLHLVPVVVFWPERGEELVIVSVPTDGSEVEDLVRVSAYDLRKNTARVMQELPVPGASAESSLAPMVLQGKRWLWIHGDLDNSECFRIDLKKGRVRKVPEKALLIGSGRKVYAVQEGPDDSAVYTRMKTFWGLKTKPLFTVPAQGDDDFGPVFAMPSHRERFACVREHGETSTLEVFDVRGRSINRVTLPAQVQSDGMPTAAEWRPDGSVLWLAVEGEDDGVQYTGLVEIGVADGAVRIIKLNEGDILGDLQPLQLALSPDGTHLAVTMMGDECVRLCLVDLSDEGRRVMLAPDPAAPQATDAG